MGKNVFFFMFLLLSSSCLAELLMDPHGHISVYPQLHGYDRSKHLYPGYYAEFMTSVDLFAYKNLFFSSVAGNKTSIKKTHDTEYKLDRIRYVLAPTLRYQFVDWVIEGRFNHECIHSIGRWILDGSIWWNSFQFSFGIKAAYYLFLRDKHEKSTDTFLDSLDFRLTAGYIIPAKNTLATGQNHDYRYDFSTLLRYSAGSYNKVSTFMTIRHETLVKSDNKTENQINLTANLFFKGTADYFGFFYTYTFHDTFSMDNTDKMGSAGFRIIF